MACIREKENKKRGKIMIRIGILGGAGYTAGELIRLLINHPEAKLVFVNSESNAGNLITDVHEGLYGDTDLRFTSEMPFDDVDMLFFCFGHGKSERFLAEHDVPAKVKIIDLAQDFRLAPTNGLPADDVAATKPTPAVHDFVYGLPEINRERIRAARHIANPGCFATCIQLGLLPAAKMGLINSAVSVNAITGSTGAGVKPGATTHFSWRNNNLSIYKAFTHQHIPEIRQSICQVQGHLDSDIDFIPYRGDFARGIFATEVIRTDKDAETIVQGYKDFYKEEPIIDGKLLVTSCIDNLLKGAVGQAVENMNLMFGLDETTGLRLKPSAF